MAELTEEEVSYLKRKIEGRLINDEKLLNFRNLIQGKTVTICLGNTRSGKSTLVNYLIGNRLRSMKRQVPGQYRLDLLDEVDGPEIRHGSLSVTDFPMVYSTSDDGVLIDSPGFEDNRGIPQDIFNALCINQIRFANSIKFVLVCYINDLLDDNVRNFTNLLSQMSHLVINIEDIQNSVSIIYTKDHNNYTPEGLRSEMNDILALEDLDIDRRLLRNLTTNDGLIGIFKMPTREGDIIFEELDGNVRSAIDACEPVTFDILNIKFALSDRSNLFLKAVYPQYTDSLYFEPEINRTVQSHNDYFDVDLYVFASYKEELEEVKKILTKVIHNLNSEGRRTIRNLEDLKKSLETLLHNNAKKLLLSDEFKASFQFILALDNALLFEEKSREIVIENYKKCMEKLLKKANKLSKKIDDEIKERERTNILLIYCGGTFAGGLGPALAGILKYVQTLVGEGINIPGSGAYGFLARTLGSTGAATAVCVVGGVFVGASVGAAYMIIKDRIFSRYNARKEQSR